MNMKFRIKETNNKYYIEFKPNGYFTKWQSFTLDMNKGCSIYKTGRIPQFYINGGDSRNKCYYGIQAKNPIYFFLDYKLGPHGNLYSYFISQDNKWTIEYHRGVFDYKSLTGDEWAHVPSDAIFFDYFRTFDGCKLFLKDFLNYIQSVKDENQRLKDIDEGKNIVVPNINYTNEIEVGDLDFNY